MRAGLFLATTSIEVTIAVSPKGGIMLFAGLVALALAANTSEILIPEGTIFSVVLNETINTKTIQEEEPVLLTLAEDIRSAGRRGPAG